MRKTFCSQFLMLAVLVAIPGMALSQAGEDIRTLVINDQPGQAPVVRIQGKSYVELEALAKLTRGATVRK